MTVERNVARKPNLAQRLGTQLWVEENQVFWEQDMKIKGIEPREAKDWLVFVNDPESSHYGQVGQLDWDRVDEGGLGIKFTDGGKELFYYSENGWPNTLVRIPKPALGDASWELLAKKQPGLEQFK